MESTVMNVTPAIARQWLEANTINRPLRHSVVEGYKAFLKRGEYRLTHQGIAFAETGELLDGQHRLTALAEMPNGFSIPIMVTRGLPPESTKGMDQGLKRSHSDILAIPTGHAAVARYMALIYETSRNAVTSEFLVPFVQGSAKPYAELTGFCSKTSKAWSSAAVRTAAILHLLNKGDADYIKVTYYALNHAEFDSMSPAAQSIYRQQVTGAANAQTYDMFCRAMKVFDHRQSHVGKLQITDPSATLGLARDLISLRVLGKPTLSRSAVKSADIQEFKGWVAKKAAKGRANV